MSNSVDRYEFNTDDSEEQNNEEIKMKDKSLVQSDTEWQRQLIKQKFQKHSKRD